MSTSKVPPGNGVLEQKFGAVVKIVRRRRRRRGKRREMHSLFSASVLGSVFCLLREKKVYFLVSFLAPTFISNSLFLENGAVHNLCRSVCFLFCRCEVSSNNWRCSSPVHLIRFANFLQHIVMVTWLSLLGLLALIFKSVPNRFQLSKRTDHSSSYFRRVIKDRRFAF